MGTHGIAEGFPQQLGSAHVRNGVSPAYNTLKGHEHKGTGTINSAEPMHQTCPPFLPLSFPRGLVLPYSRTALPRREALRIKTFTLLFPGRHRCRRDLG